MNFPRNCCNLKPQDASALKRFSQELLSPTIFSQISNKKRRSLKNFSCRNIFQFECIFNCKTRKTNDFHVRGDFQCFSNFRLRADVVQRQKMFSWKDFPSLIFSLWFSILHSNFLLIEWKYEVSLASAFNNVFFQ